MPNLKIATTEDLSEVRRMAREHVYASPYRTCTIDEQKLTATVMALINGKKTETICVLGMHGDLPVGCVAAMVQEPPFSTGRVAVELLLWVDPEHRQSRLGAELVKAYKYWAENVASCSIVSMTAPHNKNHERLGLFYERQGFVPTEHTYVRGL